MSDITEENRNLFCIRFLYEMTPVGRGVWSNDSTSDSQKSEALKWINEINHRILGAYGNSDYAITELEELLAVMHRHHHYSAVM